MAGKVLSTHLETTSMEQSVNNMFKRLKTFSLQNIILVFILFKVSLEKLELLYKDNAEYEYQKRLCLHKSYLNQD